MRWGSECGGMGVSMGNGRWLCGVTIQTSSLYRSALVL